MTNPTVADTETAHTPGPWEVEVVPDAVSAPDYYVRPAGGHHKSVAYVCALLDADMREANARLIAAAPELLAALIELSAETPVCWDKPRPRWRCGRACRHYDCGCPVCDARRRAEAAIAAARGEAVGS